MNPVQTIREFFLLPVPHSPQDTLGYRLAKVRAEIALTEIERTHYTAEDVADASAQGFRDGVASVTAGLEPVAWVVCSVNSDGSLSLEHAAAWKEAAHEHINDAITEHGIEDAASWVVRPAYVAAPVAQQPQARPDFTDEWTGYLKDGETPFERFLRERKDVQSVLKLYQRTLEENERLKAQQPQAEVVPITSESGNQAAQGASAITSGPLLSNDTLLAMWSGNDERFMRPVLGRNKVLTYGRAIEQAVRSKLGAGVPMTREDRYDAFTAAERAAGENISPWSFDQGVRAAERHHGIVGKEGGNV